MKKEIISVQEIKVTRSKTKIPYKLNERVDALWEINGLSRWFCGKVTKLKNREIFVEIC